MDRDEDDQTRLRKRPRKSRSRGLRTRTGCNHLATDTGPNIQPSLSANDVSLLGVAPQPLTTSTWSADSAFWTADFASTRWLDLLANDAAQADSGFSLVPTPALREGEERPPDIGSLQARLSQVAEVEPTSWKAGEALAYTSYTKSEELLATAIVISSYEMLDESDGRGNWQRHLKGVFWIQRSQDVNGGSGGLRQAVWWAWLRQDIWAAFREKRPCLSFWVPVQDLSGELLCTFPCCRIRLDNESSSASGLGSCES
uniref:Uncharacterized protein n=1 Tax=Fusarium oxysporum (strain Fo5176) TaxID=660025 RepID=A0A0D2XKM4_FUSOF